VHLIIIGYIDYRSKKSYNFHHTVSVLKKSATRKNGFAEVSKNLF